MGCMTIISCLIIRNPEISRLEVEKSAEFALDAMRYHQLSLMQRQHGHIASMHACRKHVHEISQLTLATVNAVFGMDLLVLHRSQLSLHT